MVTTADGWLGTVRSIRWSPLLVTPLVCSLSLVLAGALADPPPGHLAMVGEAGLAFTALAAAFIADDATRDAAPAMPTEARARLAARAVLTVPVTVVGWFVVLAVYVWSAPVPPVVGERALAGLGLATAALALAALSGKLRAVESPGAAGVGAMVALGMVRFILPSTWRAALPPGEVLWPLIIMLALITVAAATREPVGG